jgi:carbonic anhydrase
MSQLEHLLVNNRAWSAEMTQRDPRFFARLAEQQAPAYLWIGCSDSRVPANQILGLLPGEIFVHRNVANVVSHTDLNCLATVQFAVEVLQVRHIIVCGHYCCSGVRAALLDERHGLVDNWLNVVRDVRLKSAPQLAALNADERLDRMCELNVLAQVENLGRSTVLRDAWAQARPISLHGWIYDIRDGLLRELTTVEQNEACALQVQAADSA